MATLAIISLFVVLTGSLVVTRVASAALMFTGLSRESARFQARSAFSGVGFTTAEAEQVVGHPVRRRIVMLLMLLGNAGIVTAISTLMLSFVDAGRGDLLPRLALVAAAVGLFAVVALSRWVDRRLSRVIEWALGRFTSLEVRDYASLLHLADGYTVAELVVEPGDWLADRQLGDLALEDEGVQVLGLVRRDGSYLGTPATATVIRPADRLMLYGRGERLAKIDCRRADAAGASCRREGIEEQRRILAAQTG